MRALWRLELLAYWRQALKPDLGEWGPFLRLAAVTIAIEGVLFLWISGGIRPLSAI